VRRERIEGGWEFFEHTADIGLRARGADLRELFENAGNGLIELMFGRDAIRPRRSLQISTGGDDDEQLLVGWLEEILFAFEGDRFAPARVEVEQVADGAARGRLWGEDFYEGKHRVHNLVKAVTYHNLTIRHKGEMYEVDLILDL